MKRKILVAFITLVLVLGFIVVYFNYDKTSKHDPKGTLVWSESMNEE